MFKRIFTKVKILSTTFIRVYIYIYYILMRMAQMNKIVSLKTYKI